jgi:DDE family transposase
VVTWVKPKVMPNWMTQEEYNLFPDSLTLRETKINKKVIVTSLLCDKEIPKKELGKLYYQRWNVELDLRNIKTTLGMEVLSCKTPEMNLKEMWTYFLAYNLIRLIMAEAAIQTGIKAT